MRKPRPIKIVVEFAQGGGDASLLDALVPLLEKAAQADATKKESKP